MTSTEFTVGLDGKRVSSKVLKPPGGGSSDIFGLGTPASSNQAKDDTSTKSRLFGSSAPVNTNLSSTPQKNKSNIFGTDVSSLTGSSKKQFVRRNPITGEGMDYPDEKTESPEKENEEENLKDCDTEKKIEIEEAKPATPKVIQTSIRVRNPPGGKSSGIF